MTSLIETRNPKSNFFFIADSKTWCGVSFESLNSSLAQSVKLWSCKVAGK